MFKYKRIKALLQAASSIHFYITALEMDTFGTFASSLMGSGHLM